MSDRPRRITTLVDNTFATPINQTPLDLGCDLAFHSATKYFGGHSDLVAGVVLGRKDRITLIWDAHVILGAVLGPFDAWLLLRRACEERREYRPDKRSSSSR